MSQAVNVRFRGINTPQDKWRTPKWLFDRLNAEFHFDLDPCAADNEWLWLCPRSITVAEDGLTERWEPAVTWVNPPFSELESWVPKCRYEGADTTVVALLPCRTGTKLSLIHI